jgi:hypothetical protein
MVNELVRLAELQIDAKLNVVRATKEIELSAPTVEKTVVFWCRATNTRTEHKFKPVNNSIDETKSRMLLWKGDIIVINRLMETQIDGLLSLVEETAHAKMKPKTSLKLNTSSAAVKKVLEKLRPKPVMVRPENADSTDPGIEASVVQRIQVMADFLEKLYAELDRVTHQTVVDGITQVVEKHARKEAEGRKVNVEVAAKGPKNSGTEVLSVVQLKEMVAAETVKRNGVIAVARAMLDPLPL